MDSKPTTSRLQANSPSEATEAGTPRRIDRLAEVVDLCTEAKRIAEALGEKLLPYLLAMAIQETRAAMRQEVSAAAAAAVKPPARRSPKPRRSPAGD